jgi:cyclase
MRTTGANNRRQLLQTGPQMVEQIRTVMEQSKNLAGATITDDERRSYQSDIEAAERFFKEAPPVEIVTPTVEVKDRLVLKQGGRSIEVLHVGAGHTVSDLVVWLPTERILISGDLVVHPVPLVGSTSLPSAFAATLEKLLAMKPAVIIPGHGPVMRDDAYLRLEHRLLTSLVSQVKANTGKASSPPEMRKLIDLRSLQKEFAGCSQLLAFIFDFYVTSPGVTAAMREIAK